MWIWNSFIMLKFLRGIYSLVANDGPINMNNIFWIWSRSAILSEHTELQKFIVYSIEMSLNIDKNQYHIHTSFRLI